MRTSSITILAIALLTTIAFAPSASAQGMYLDKGTSGFGFEAGYESLLEMNALGATIGYSYNGIVDIATGISRSTFDGLDDVSALGFSPNVTVYPVKQNRSMPVSFGLMAGYENQSYSGDPLDAAETEISMTGFNLGAEVFGAFPASKTTRFIPRFAVNYFTGELESTIADADPVKVDADITTFELGGSYAINLPSGSTFALGANATITEDGDTGFGIGLNMIFPMGVSR